MLTHALRDDTWEENAAAPAIPKEGLPVIKPINAATPVLANKGFDVYVARKSEAAFKVFILTCVISCAPLPEGADIEDRLVIKVAKSIGPDCSLRIVSSLLSNLRLIKFLNSASFINFSTFT